MKSSVLLMLVMYFSLVMDSQAVQLLSDATEHVSGNKTVERIAIQRCSDGQLKIAAGSNSLDPLQICLSASSRVIEPETLRVRSTVVGDVKSSVNTGSNSSFKQQLLVRGLTYGHPGDDSLMILSGPNGLVEDAAFKEAHRCLRLLKESIVDKFFINFSYHPMLSGGNDIVVQCE